MTPAMSVEPEREVVEHRVGELRDQRLLVVVGGRAAQLVAAVVRRSCTPVSLASTMMPMNSDHRDDAEQQQRRRGVARLRLLEGGHAVADRLDTGERRAARRERPGDQEHQWRSPSTSPCSDLHLEARGLGLQLVAEDEDLEQPPAEHDVHADHERVGRNRERGARLPDAAQVQRRQNQDRGDREQHLVLGDERDRRPDVATSPRPSTPRRSARSPPAARSRPSGPRSGPRLVVTTS